METRLRKDDMFEIELFKSYYVVWKPQEKEEKEDEEEGLNRTMQYGNYYFDARVVLLHSSFKSYYVVWKPSLKCISMLSRLRLNRTMQYGNQQTKLTDISNKLSLNRTMQYGNHWKKKRTSTRKRV